MLKLKLRDSSSLKFARFWSNNFYTNNKILGMFRFFEEKYLNFMLKPSWVKILFQPFSVAKKKSRIYAKNSSYEMQAYKTMEYSCVLEATKFFFGILASKVQNYSG